MTTRARLSDLKKRLADRKAARQKDATEFRQLVEREADLPDGETLPEAEQTRLDQLQAAITGHDTAIGELSGRVERLENAIAVEADAAMSGDGDDDGADGERSQGPGRTRSLDRSGFQGNDPKIEKGAFVPMAIRFLMQGQGAVWAAAQIARQADGFGERHPVTRALNLSVGASGALIVPPEYVAELIELQRAATVVRRAGPRVIPMPRGTMQMPRQNQAATANYGGESTAIAVSEQGFGMVTASYKKLVAMVPITNDLARYSNPAVDAIARDDLVQVLGRREDLAFIRGDGTADSPKGFRTYNLASQLITSTAAFTLATVARELGGAINKLESANVAMRNPGWIFHPRTKNYLLNVQNANGYYVFKEEMTEKGTLLGYPFYTTTQIPTNLVDGSSNTDCSEVYFVDFSEAMIFDAMALEIAISREGTYVDASGATVSVFQSDQTLIRAIAEHDFGMRHDNAIAVIDKVRWAPAIT